jgi:hypothetical protein
VKAIAPFANPLAAAVALTLMLGSLYFSEIANFLPCKLFRQRPRDRAHQPRRTRTTPGDGTPNPRHDHTSIALANPPRPSSGLAYGDTPT